MSTFSYEKRGKINEMNFNPELLGFLYHDCKCTSVKFKKRTDGTFKDYDSVLTTELHFYTESQKLNVLKLHTNENGQNLIDSNVTLEYPKDQEHLEELLKDY